VKLDLTGDKRLIRAMTELPVKVQKKVLRSAVAKGGRIVRKAVKAATPVGKTKNLKRNAFMRTRTYGGQTVAAIIGHKWPKGAHAHLVEFGHAGPHPAPPHPFMRLAWDATKAQARRTTEDWIRDGVLYQAAILGGIRMQAQRLASSGAAETADAEEAE
jgi:HK97 gp10 family phage protein